VNGNINLADGFLKLPKLGKVKIKQHRQIPEGFRLKSVTVSLASSGKYHASILYEYDADIMPVKPIRVVGLDFSMSNLYVDSSGKSAEYPRYYRKCLNFGKSVYDNGFGMFKSMLAYKLAESGKHFVMIGKWFPSSKLCSSCGSIKDELQLSERAYQCACGFVCGRDQNAAINIRNEGLRMIA
jgi:putative transposase